MATAMMSTTRRALLTLALAALPLGATAQDKTLVMASTTSTEQSGLFAFLLPEFKKATGIEVKVVAQGTGQALDMGRRGDADILFVHDKVAEEKFVAEGFGLPRRPLRVSPQHRMLYRHIRIPLLFGEDAVFVRAKSLAASFEEIYVDSSIPEITYYHLVFDAHEVIYAEGAATESFHPGPEGIAALDPEARAELFAIFPQLRAGGVPEAAFPTLRRWELMAMVG